MFFFLLIILIKKTNFVKSLIPVLKCNFFFFNTLVPDAPGSFTVSEVYSDALRVSWDRPLRVNGVLLAYLLKHWRNDTSPSNAHTTRLPNVTLSYTVTGLSANTIYSVELSAQTRAGIGTSKRLSAMTTQSPGKIT